MIPEPVLILLLSLALVGLGWFFARLYYRSRFGLVRRAEWQAASIYYERKYNPGERRL